MENILSISGATSATIYVSTATNYKREDYKSYVSSVLNQATSTTYQSERQAHVIHYQKLFKRVTLNLKGSDRNDLPTDLRLKRFATNPNEDKGLATLYFQYGRYLLISSTRPGLLPPNLQGLWANTLQTPWNGDYHLDINIQMNHWPLDVTGLGDLNAPFFELVRSLVSPGEKTARAYYNSPGWVAHVITNIQITSDGHLMEWSKPYQAVDLNHRHVSPLWGLFPGSEINQNTPELENAAKKLLEERGDIGTGWSLAWKMSLWARLHDGNRAFKLFHSLLKPVTSVGTNMKDGGGSYVNLFCAHPPFQIDGNFGGTAGIAEMLLQSQQWYAELLPALPDNWADGSFSGLHARGGLIVGAEWESMKIKNVTLKAMYNESYRIKFQKGIKRIKLIPGNMIKYLEVAADGIVELNLLKDRTVRIEVLK